MRQLKHLHKNGPTCRQGTLMVLLALHPRQQPGEDHPNEHYLQRDVFSYLRRPGW